MDSETAKTILDQLEKEFLKVQGHVPKNKTGNDKVVAMTAVALNLAKENVELKIENSKLKTQIEERSENLLKILEREIGTSP